MQLKMQFGPLRWEAVDSWPSLRRGRRWEGEQCLSMRQLTPAWPVPQKRTWFWPPCIL